jgi:hypothetical protein
MKTKNALLALAATSLLALAIAGPVSAADEPAPPDGSVAGKPVAPDAGTADPGAGTADPGAASPGDANPDPGADQGAGDAGAGDAGGAPAGGNDAPD